MVVLKIVFGWNCPSALFCYTQLPSFHGILEQFFYNINPWLDFFKYIDEIRETCHVVC